MSQETGDDAALLRTIAELRSDVNRLIDEQLAKVQALEAKRSAEAVPERRFSAPPPASQPVARPARAAAAPRTREPVEAAAKPESDDPGQRLDALARHLDGRLRRSDGKTKAAQGERSPDKPGRTPGNENGTAGDARR